MMAMAILDKWRKLNRNSRFVFDFLEENFDLRDEPKLQRRKDSVNHTINVSLKSVGYKIGLDFALTMHVARHTYAVLAINNGMDRKMLSTTMGHSSTVITEKVYATVLSESIEEEMSKMQMLYKDIDIDRFEK
jgi:integrase